MPRKQRPSVRTNPNWEKSDDYTQLRCTSAEKAEWKRKAKLSGARSMAQWIRWKLAN